MNAFHCFIIIIEGLWLRFIRFEPFISIRDLSIRDESDVTTGVMSARRLIVVGVALAIKNRHRLLVTGRGGSCWHRYVS